MKIGFLITARLKSSRLPLKLLKDLNGKNVLERVIDRCKKVADVDEIILCTSLNPQDRSLVDVAVKNDIYYFLGNEEDVLQRLSDAATFYGLDYIIGITGENPLFSIYHASIVVNQAKMAKNDFIYIDGLPIGCAVYGIRPEALKTVCEVKTVVDTEIWGPLINQPEIFDVFKIKVDSNYEYKNLRVTLDYFEDYAFLSKVFSFFDAAKVPTYFEFLELMKSNPELTKIHEGRKQLALDGKVLNEINQYYSNNKEAILKIKNKYY